jgi:hypothetical protein
METPMTKMAQASLLFGQGPRRKRCNPPIIANLKSCDDKVRSPKGSSFNRAIARSTVAFAAEALVNH